MIGIDGRARLSNVVEVCTGHDHRQVWAQESEIWEQALGRVKELE